MANRNGPVPVLRQNLQTFLLSTKVGKAMEATPDNRGHKGSLGEADVLMRFRRTPAGRLGLLPSAPAP